MALLQKQDYEAPQLSAIVLLPLVSVFGVCLSVPPLLSTKISHGGTFASIPFPWPPLNRNNYFSATVEIVCVIVEHIAKVMATLSFDATWRQTHG